MTASGKLQSKKCKKMRKNFSERRKKRLRITTNILSTPSSDIRMNKKGRDKINNSKL